MRILIFGTGDYYHRFKKWLAQEDVIALIDNSLQKQGTVIDGIRVLSPEEAVKLPYEKIIILSFYVREMRRQLVGLHVADEDILHFYDLHDFLKGRRLYHPIKASDQAKSVLDNNSKKKETILLLSTDMLCVGGPAKVLFSAGKILKERGFSVLFASMTGGELEKEIEEAGIPVIVDDNLQVSTMEEIEWIKDFKLIFCNTINFYVFLSKRNCGIPVVWWLHDSAFFYGGVNKKILNSISTQNLRIVSVGDVPRKVMQESAPQFEIGELLYGTKDKKGTGHKHCGNKVCFAVIGYVENRKGQDILVEAVQCLPTCVKERLQVYMIGKNVSALAVELTRKIAEIPEIIMTGMLGTEEFEEYFQQTEVLVCPSREDPMPAVVSEAMRVKIPCIVSNATGTAEYIREGVEGWIFENENVSELAEKMKWCVENKERLSEIGQNARKLYERTFSMEIFEKNLLELIEGKGEGWSCQI